MKTKKTAIFCSRVGYVKEKSCQSIFILTTIYKKCSELIKWKNKQTMKQKQKQWNKTKTPKQAVCAQYVGWSISFSYGVYIRMYAKDILTLIYVT